MRGTWGTTFTLMNMAFGLLPAIGGCIVTTPAANGGGFVATLPQQTLWISVERGHSYTLETGFNDVSGPVSSGTMGVADHGPDGSVTAARGCQASAAAP